MHICIYDKYIYIYQIVYHKIHLYWIIFVIFLNFHCFDYNYHITFSLSLLFFSPYLASSHYRHPTGIVARPTAFENSPLVFSYWVWPIDPALWIKYYCIALNDLDKYSSCKTPTTAVVDKYSMTNTNCVAVIC